MKIGFSGTHSTGKTTLARKIKEHLPEYYLDVNVSRWVHSLGFTLNQFTSDAAQEINLIKRITHLNSYDKILADRTIVDNIAYTIAGWELGKISPESLEYQMEMYYLNLEKYDIIFYIPPEIDLVIDEVRPHEEGYRLHIDNLIRKMLFDKSSLHRLDKVYELTGTLEERQTKVLDKINEMEK